MAELWDIYDERRCCTGKFHKRGEPLKQGEFHLVAEAWVINSDGRLLITKRHPEKTYGNMWECTGGAVVAGENSLQGIKRELSEEIGVVAKDSEISFVGTISGNSWFTDIYLFRSHFNLNKLKLQAEEVIAAKLVTKDEFLKMAADGVVIPHLIDNMKTFDADFIR